MHVPNSAQKCNRLDPMNILSDLSCHEVKSVEQPYVLAVYLEQTWWSQNRNSQSRNG